MKEYTERRQLNNEGFSLIELLIAIVILAIIVVPLLHSFVTSARTNAKSRNTMHGHGHRRGCHGAVRGTYTGGDGRHL